MKNILLIEQNKDNFEDYKASYLELGYKVFPKSYEELFCYKDLKEFYRSMKRFILLNDISSISIDLSFELYENTGVQFVQKLLQDNILKIRTLPLFVISHLEQSDIKDYQTIEEMVSIYINKKEVLALHSENDLPQLKRYLEKNRIDTLLESDIKAYNKFNYISYNHIFNKNKTYKEINSIKDEIITSLNENSDNEVVPFFQSIVNSNQKIIKYEVLANIGHERNSFYKYNTVAKFYGLLNYITEAMIRKSLKKMKNNKDIELSINIDYEDLVNKNDDIDDFKIGNEDISEKQLKNLPLQHFKNSKFFEFITFLNHEVAINGLAPEQITLEILEASQQNKYIDTAIQQLKQAGYKIAIDDFGVENSNFMRLKNQLDERYKIANSNGRIDYIKIDAEFIKGVSSSKVLQSIVNSIINFAKVNKIKTVVEHIDNPEDFTYCRSIDVDLFQGYLFDEPTHFKS